MTDEEIAKRVADKLCGTELSLLLPTPLKALAGHTVTFECPIDDRVKRWPPTPPMKADCIVTGFTIDPHTFAFGRVLYG